MQRRAEGQRRQPLRLPQLVEMGHARPAGGDRAKGGLAGFAIPLGCIAFARRNSDRKDRQHAVADELQHLTAEGMHCAGDAVEPGIQR